MREEIADIVSRIEMGEKVETVVENMQEIIDGLFREHKDVHVEVFVSESVTWIRRVNNENS